ncbi:hypothetical protein N9N65_03965 [Amylibacter sp.]|nr:hypothetical protein [Amylibacter sp.]MDB2610652.1 hypothetical protein [Amylibacter sp.]
MNKEKRSLSFAASIVASSLVLTAPAFADGEVVFASWGGVISRCIAFIYA